MNPTSNGWCTKLMFWKRRRHLVTFLAFLGFFNVYTLRVNLSVGIVAMNSPYNVTLDNGTVQERQDFHWDSKTRGVVLGSFFYGYILTQVLGGWLASRIGGNRVFGLGVTVTAFFTLLTPPAANISVYLLVALRIFEGLFEGMAFPCIHAVWANWAPPEERSQMAAVAFSGMFVGTVVGMPVSGFIATTLGWPPIFYITGAVGLMWCVIWFIVVKDRPENDPHISSEELKYIKKSLGDHGSEIRSKIKHPWKKFLTSMPVWAIVVAHTCENWGYYTLLTQLPMFMKDTFDFQLSKAGFVASMPYLVMSIVLQFAAGLSNWLQSKNILSITQVRKLFTSGAFGCQTVFMFLAGHMGSPSGVVTCLILAVGLEGFAWSAFSVNHLDIAPQHASVLMGLSNTLGTVPGIISPLLTGYIVTNGSADQWQFVFYIASAIYLFGALFYGIFASGDKQPWAMDEDRTLPQNSQSKSKSTVHNDVDNK